MIFFGEDANPSTSTANSVGAQTDFLSNLSGVQVEDFETTLGSTAPLSVDFGTAGTATIFGSGSLRTSPGFGRFATSGATYWQTGSDGFSIEFSQAVSAFGFFGTDIGDFGGQVTLTFNDDPSTLINIGNTTGIADGSQLYFGIIDAANPFTKISFANTDGDDVFGFDDFTIGTAQQVVVESSAPATALLILASIAGLFGFRKKV